MAEPDRHTVVTPTRDPSADRTTGRSGTIHPEGRALARAAAGAAYRHVARPLLFRLDAEVAHHGTVVAAELLGRTPQTRALASLVGYAVGGVSSPVELLGLRFPHRVGLAAGMDKDGRGAATWGALGFGHAELGTVTPRPQGGNPRPRLFRLPQSQAVINRMGFNNAGVEAMAGRLRSARDQGLVTIPVGVSIGKNKDTPVEDAVSDYLTCVRVLDGLADYLAVNVSSPNTPGLRSLQDAEPLGELLRAVVQAAGETPVLVKLAPDLSDAALDEALDVALAAGVSGIIAINTTLDRSAVAPEEAALAQAQAGGLSGGPLTFRAREVVRQVRSRTDLPVVGVGGVLTGSDAAALVQAGADLVQLYSGLVYAGPTLVADVTDATSGTG
ncbi:quinone-dependent dihydroorotate dehydrogenase [Ornithinimicrobium sufpigmenti]|uniref:quinone-dependent dihydroorotate dehydrogenase n=1 Tax=Ornithinimicrobium sufpigmenti TaxID=2508882 RepID=UPI0010361BFC|nr:MULTISPECIES: quinone-dependent dihydroorotate dehydrogenase [unclassified Ornithinimicrobium]